jgi:hypothetical protein
VTIASVLSFNSVKPTGRELTVGIVESGLSYLNNFQSDQPSVAQIAKLIATAKIHGLGDEYFKLG